MYATPCENLQFLSFANLKEVVFLVYIEYIYIRKFVQHMQVTCVRELLAATPVWRRLGCFKVSKGSAGHEHECCRHLQTQNT